MSAGTFAERPHRAAPITRSGLRSADRALLAAGLLTVLAAVLRFVRIAHQGFWFDEGNTALLVHQSPGGMLGLLPHSESTPPLYYCLLWLWARVFGFTEGPLRAFSALAGTLVVPVGYAIGRRLASERAGLVLAALIACNPLLIWYSQEARSYELLVLMSGLSLLTLLPALDQASPRRLALWALCSAAALCTHYYAVLLVAPAALWLLIRWRWNLTVVIAIVVVAAVGIALVPLAHAQQATGHANWIANAALGRRLSQVVPQFLAGFKLPAQTLLVAVAGALCALALLLALARGDERTRRGVLIGAGLALVGLVLNLLLIAGGVDDLLTRNLLALWPPAALAVAVALGSPRASIAGLLATAAICGVGVVGVIDTDMNRNLQRHDWRGVARLLGPAPAGGGRRAILIQHYKDLLPLSLYEHGLHFMPHRGASVTEFDVVSFTSPRSGGFCWWGSACNLWPSRMQERYAMAGFRVLSRRSVYQFTVLRMVATGGPVPVSVHELHRVLHSTKLDNDEVVLQG